MKRAARIALLYAAVAALATGVNIACQALTIAIHQGQHAVVLSVLVGTAAGLPVKYGLEKRLVFAFRSRGLAHDGRLFVVYSFLGVFTTLVFWGIEFAFHWVFGTHAMRYLGGAIGLSVGSVIKYHLDRRFVFAPPMRQGTAGAM
ncbi:MAG: GtrA family protein [Ramlibacter sp.]|nr:GtrA family protein [Ramlibacter sp.]